MCRSKRGLSKINKKRERRERERDSARNSLITPPNLESTVHLFGVQLTHTVPQTLGQQYKNIRREI